MKLVIASQNCHKIKEIKQILEDINWEIITLSELDPDFQILEDGKTFEENARKKAQTIMEKFNYITLGEDTGLEVKTLNNEPGIYSARYAGEKASYKMNMLKLLSKLKNLQAEQRVARFQCICALAFPKSYNRKIRIFKGVCEGHIINIPHGKLGFGYDPIFVPKGYTETFAQLSQNVKNSISHRAKALYKVKLYLQEFTAKNAEGGS